jgi:hypothetical protein
MYEIVFHSGVETVQQINKFDLHYFSAHKMSKIFAVDEEAPPPQNSTATPKEFLSYQGWWGARVRKYAKSPDDMEGLEKLKESVLNDYTAWTVFVALLMTVDFAALMVSPGNYAPHDNEKVVEILKYIYIGSFALAAMSSLSAAFAGIQGYNLYNGVPVDMLDLAISKSWDMPHPTHYGSTAACATMVGMAVGIYLLFGIGESMLLFFCPC